MKTNTRFLKSIQSPERYDVLKKGSSNKKLGFKVTAKRWTGKRLYSLTLTERKTCPISCHHWEDCYGNNMPFAHRFEEGTKLTTKLAAELDILCAKHKEGVVVRLHVLGDFYSVAYVAFWWGMLEKHPNLCVFGYTGREPDSKIGGSVHALNIAYPDRWVVRFSRSKTSVRDGHWFAAEENFEGKHFNCPEQPGRVPSCAACGLCWSVATTVRFTTH